MTRSSRPASETAPGAAPIGIDARWTALLRAFGEVLGEVLEVDSGPHRAGDRMSRAVMPLVPHDWLDFALTEADRGLYRMRAMAELPIGDVPGEPSPIEDPALLAVVRDGEALHAPTRIVVPLRLGERIIGYLELRHRGAWAYRADHLEAARIIADLTAPAGETMHLYKLEDRTRRRLATVIEVGRAMGQSLDLDEILPIIGRALLETLHLPGCDIYVHDEARRALVPLAPFGDSLPDPGRFKPIPAPVTDALLGAREPLLIDRAGRTRPVRRAEMAARVAADDSPGWALAMPLVLRDRPVGLALLPIPEGAGGFGQDQLALAMGIAQAAGVAIEHARLYARARELGVSKERNRLAREMHDTLAQGLAAISIQLDVAERLLPSGAEAKRVVEGAHDLARRALDEARRAVWGLAPTALDGRSLSAALADEVERFTHRSGVVAELTAEGDAPALGDEQATALLRVAQEALHNVEKHATAGRVRAELTYDERDGAITLLLADDGRGFDRRQRGDPHSGFGLTSMRERMRLVGGELEVESAPGWGTRVRARLPVGIGEPETGGDGQTPAEEHADAAPVRVLVVDDHPLARQGVRRLLEGHPDVVLIGEAIDGAQGVEQALVLRPDVVLMDLQMPRLSGAGAVHALRNAWPEARVLILTTFARDEDVFAALRAGARGYLLKDASQAELVEAIRTVHRGGSAAPPSIAARVFDRVGQLAAREHLPEELTERELDVLRLAAAGARNREIAERLVVSEKTVKNYLSQVYGKLGASNRTEAVARARTLGVLPLDPPGPDDL